MCSGAQTLSTRAAASCTLDASKAGKKGGVLQRKKEKRKREKNSQVQRLLVRTMAGNPARTIPYCTIIIVRGGCPWCSGRRDGPLTSRSTKDVPVVPEHRASHSGLFRGRVAVSAKNSNILSYKPPGPRTRGLDGDLSNCRNDLHLPLAATIQSPALQCRANLGQWTN